MVDSSTVQCKGVKVQVLQHGRDNKENMMPTLNEILSKTKIVYNPSSLDKETDMNNIDFIPLGETDGNNDKTFLF
jgi:hypothetical protein